LRRELAGACLNVGAQGRKWIAVLNGSVTVTNGRQNEQYTAPKRTSIHAILIEKDGGIGELWLPATVEGKYTFPIAEEYISIIAEDSNWKACVANGGYFSLADPTSGNTEVRTREVFLHSNSLYVAHFGTTIFSLYLEDDCDGSRVFHPYYLERNMDIFIGREPACDIQYLNRFVSREHAVLRYVGDQLFISDKNSKNGVYVNGQRIQSIALELGDVVHIQFGNNQLTVKVLLLSESCKKEDAANMYEIA